MRQLEDAAKSLLPIACLLHFATLHFDIDAGQVQKLEKKTRRLLCTAARNGKLNKKPVLPNANFDNFIAEKLILNN